MTQLRNLVVQIYKNTIILFVFVSMSVIPAFCVEYGQVSNGAVAIDYSKIDKDAVLKDADENFTMALVEVDAEKQKEFIQKAKAQYYTVTLADKKNMHAITMLARIHDMCAEDRYAKAYYSRAIGLNYKDPLANYYFGDFYYNRDNYKMALKYYRNAFEYGLNENSKNLEKMALIYEKFGDLQRASIYYKKMFLKNPSSEDIPDKIREIEEIKYQNTDYYKGH